MAFCNKCGLKLETGDQFCPKCGAKVRLIDEDPASETETASEGQSEKTADIAVAVAAALSKGELIKRLERYRKNLINQKQLRARKSDLASRADSRERPLLSERAHLIKFYWPYLTAGAVLLVLTYIISIIAAVKGSGYITVIIVGAVISLIVFIAGLVIAKNNQQATLAQIREHNGKIERRQQYAEELNRVCGELSKVDKLVREDNELVPKQYRNADQISRLIAVFKGPNVNTVEEAMQILEKKKK